MIPNRIKWSFYRRLKIAKSIEGFWAHLLSYADENCIFSEYNQLHMGTKIINSKLGRFSYVTNARIGHSHVGAFCSIAPDACIGGLGHHPTNFISTHPSFYSTSRQAGISFTNKNAYDEFTTTTLGNDVWVGARSIILDGVNISDGAIIGAGAVVTKDVPPYCIVAGVPARAIRKRYDDSCIAELLDWRWWELPTHTLSSIAPKFCSDEIDIEKIKQLRSHAAEIQRQHN